jgi:hypothetical protein
MEERYAAPWGNRDIQRQTFISLGDPQGNVTALQGVSGRLFFDTLGNPVDKAVAVLYLRADGDTDVIKLKQISGTFQ